MEHFNLMSVSGLCERVEYLLAQYYSNEYANERDILARQIQEYNKELSVRELSAYELMAFGNTFHRAEALLQCRAMGHKAIARYMIE